MHPYIRQHPFLPVCVVFIAGILSSTLDEGPILNLLIIGAVTIFLAILTSWLRGIRRVPLQVFFIFLGFYFLGISRHRQQARVHQPRHFSHFMSAGLNEVTGEILEVNRSTILLRVDRINDEPVSGRLSIFSKYPLASGDMIFAPVVIRDIPGPKNPFLFNFQKFYHHKQIWHQANFGEKPLFLGKNRGFRTWVNQLRSGFREKLREKLPGENEFALANALILGDKRELGTEMRNAYADTGAMHVLAVSGLHVGVVYLLLMFFLKRVLPVHRGWKIVRSLITLGGLWLFVCLAGAPVSARRAAFMFSLLETGKISSRNYYPVNTLALAAFALLLLDPNSLFDVGFQLSFLAVLGILICQRPIQNLWPIKSAAGFKVWQFISMSMAAQIFTFPLSIYYFHQFPMYFWLSGIVAVPMASVVLGTGLPALIFSWIPGLDYLLTQALFYSTWLLNGWIFVLRYLPGLVAEHLYISKSQLILLFLIAGSLSLLINSRRSRHICYVLGFLALFMLMANLKRLKVLHQRLLVVYPDREAPYVDLVLGQTAFPLHPVSQEAEIPADLNVTRRAMGIRKVEFKNTPGTWYQDGGFAGIGPTRIYRQEDHLPDLSGLPEVDYLLLDFVPGLERLGQLSPSTHLIVNDHRLHLTDTLKSMGYQVSNLHERGFIIQPLKYLR